MNETDCNIKMICTKHGDVPFLIVEADEHKKTYCLVCFDEVMTRLGVHCVRPVVVEPVPVEWPDYLEVK